jgi:DNA-binding Xre family transcriptional regulator
MIMGISYKKLFHLMIDRGIRKSELRAAAGISTSTLAKLGNDEYVSLDVLVRICGVLDCDIGDVCEITKEG